MAIERDRRDWVQVLRREGLATLLTLFLVWLMANNLAASVVRMTDMLRDHVSDTNYYLRAICLNTATTEAQRAGCIPTHPQ